MKKPKKHYWMIPTHLRDYFDGMLQIESHKIENGFELELHKSIPITYKMLRALAEWFGTEKIDVNNAVGYGGGCETCAYEYVDTTIQIYNPTFNYNPLDTELGFS